MNNIVNAEFIENVQKWVALDSQLKNINEKTRVMRDAKHELAHKINQHVEQNNMRDNKIEISDGSLRFCDKKEYAPLTFGYIEESLNKLISNKENVGRILKHLKENRDIKTSPDIRRTFTK